MPLSKLNSAPPRLRDAVLKVPVGTVSLASEGGNHTIVAVVAYEAAGQRDLSMPAVKESITNTLKARKEQLLRAAYLTAARSDANGHQLSRPPPGRIAGQGARRRPRRGRKQ